MTRWDVDQQIADLATRHGFQVLDDRVDVEAGDERSRRLHDRPRLAHELAQAPRRELAVNLVAQVGFCQ